MNEPIRLIVLGGFLGSGKTTSLLALARYYAGLGYRTAAITNDHGSIGFDTQTIRAQAIEAREISEGCLCCRFRDFLYAADDLLNSTKPEIILAEPVGTCLNLPRGLLLPISRYTGERYTTAPLSVLVDPHRYREMKNGNRAEDCVRYLFEQQLREADILVVNKCDTLSDKEQDEVLAGIRADFPLAQLKPISAFRGDGMESWGRYLLDETWQENPQRSAVDYDRYIDAESSLGYLDCELAFRSEDELDLIALTRGGIALLKDRFEEIGARVAHVKTAGSSGRGSFRVHWTGLGEPEWIAVEKALESADCLTVTVRAKGDPDRIAEVFRATFQEVAAVQRAEPIFRSLRAFRPRPPRGECKA
ncbi:MAG TPA: GTP-binding protein [bacterium]|nr:GTP-binding protein [bacterium]HQO35000.1 GTP-binding protein [bacterium]HQP98168.1 GTP-binding protein [bacterium]